MLLEERVAVVTGSGRGLGRAIAERLAHAGADVAIHDLDATAPAKYGEAVKDGSLIRGKLLEAPRNGSAK